MRKLSTINYQLSTSKGLTLIELLIVFALIGVVASVILVYINPLTQFQRARDTRRKADLAQIQAALEFYRTDHGYYPATVVFPSNCGDAWTVTDTVVTNVTYLQSFPCDPTGNAPNYTYTAGPSGCTNVSPPGTFCTTYSLVACLEITSDPQAIPPNVCTLPRVSYTVKNS